LFSALVLLFCILVPSVNMLIDYILPHKYMEATVKRKHGTIIEAKLIVNAVIFYIGVGINLLVNLVFKEIIPNGKKYYLVRGDKGVDIILYMIFGIIIPIILLFFYMLTYCIKTEIKHRVLLMIILIATTFSGIYLLKVALINKIFELGVAVGFILIVTSLTTIIENKYEPR
jgi:pheromone shutdown protein TraB